MCGQNAILAKHHYIQQTPVAAAVVEGRTDELVGLYVQQDGGKRGGTTALLCWRAVHFIPPWQCLLSPWCIHMDGLYSSLCPFKYRAPVGIQFSCNNNGNIHPPHAPHHPRQAVIIIVTLGARCLPAGPWTVLPPISSKNLINSLNHCGLCMCDRIFFFSTIFC